MNDSRLRFERRNHFSIDQDLLVTSSPPLAATPSDERKRHIRSFVLRQGRFTPAQQRAFEDHWAHFGLEPASAPRDYAQIFGRNAPLVLEIGFGNGEQLLHAGMHEPEKDFIGIEVHRPGVGRLMNALAVHKVDNVRLYNHDAMDILRQSVAPGALSEVRIYFPDPWPKKRQQKRRMIQPEFADLLASRLAVGGRLHLATDWADYAAHMLAVLDQSPDFHNTAGNGQSVPRPDWRIETHFEKRGLRLGHGVWDFIYTRGKSEGFVAIRFSHLFFNSRSFPTHPHVIPA